MRNLQVGQRLSVVEILNNGSYGDHVFPPGSWCAGYEPTEKDLSGLQVLERDGDFWLYLQADDFKLKGALVITKVK